MSHVASRRFSSWHSRPISVTASSYSWDVIQISVKQARTYSLSVRDNDIEEDSGNND